MIQNVIDRMASNSFLLKRWSIILVSAAIALSRWGDLGWIMLLMAIPIGLLWMMDSFYLCMERRYRKYYDKVRIKKGNEIDFSMKCHYLKGEFISAMISKTEVAFYAILIATIVIAAIMNIEFPLN